MIRLWRIFSLLAVGFALVVLAADGGRAQKGGHVARLIVEGPIGPAVADYIGRGIDKAAEGGAVAVILQMDTPGGLDTSMRAIIKDILAAPVPVIGYVGPSGARAASAGTYMLYASHLAVMAPATNLGAATPVQMGAPGGQGDTPKDDEKGGDSGKADKTDAGDSETTADEDPADGEQAASEDEGDSAKTYAGKPGMEEKVLNDAVAYIKGLAQKRGRNAEWAVRAVTEAASLSAADALAEGVIDFIAESPAEILEKADGQVVDLNGRDHRLETAGLAVVDLPPDWRTELLEVITDPTVAYMLLFTIGVPALLIEFYTGTLIAGVIGAICIVLGLYGLHVLPIDYAGAGLILLGLALLVAEAFVPSVGVLGIGGVVAFVIGSVMLIDTDVPGFGISPWLIGSVATAAGAVMLLVIAVIIRSREQPLVSGGEAIVGGTGIVLDWSDESGHVRFQGEVWQARAANGPVGPGQEVRVAGREGLVLLVEPAGEAETETEKSD